MKRFGFVLLAVTLALGIALVSCGDDNGNVSGGGNQGGGNQGGENPGGNQGGNQGSNQGGNQDGNQGGNQGGTPGPILGPGNQGGGTSPTITTTALPGGTVGTAYSQTLTATGTTPITWSIDTGVLPGGLTLSAGIISGTPSTAGTFNFTVKATNAAGSGTKALSIVIAQSSDNTPGGNTPVGESYIITYDINGGSGTTPSNHTVTIDTLFIPTLARGSGFLKSGYAFGGWNTKADGTGNQFFIDMPIPIYKDITLFAKWNNAIGGNLTVTGIPSEYNGKYAYFKNGYLLPVSSASSPYHGFQNVTGWSEGYYPAAEKIILCQIVNGSVSLPMWVVMLNGFERYSGNDKIGGHFEIFDISSIRGNSVDDRFFDIIYSNGSATVTWDSGW